MPERAPARPVLRAETSVDEVLVVCSVDTEEDDWEPARAGVAVENLRELPEHHRWLRDLGVRPTYFVSYQAVRDADAASPLRELAADDGAEIGAHLHPWNTPPWPETLTSRSTMLGNLAPELQEAKLRRLVDRLGESLGRRPVSFRAGRCGLGAGTIGPLVRAGFLHDSSVVPFVDLRGDHGPDFRAAPVGVYRIAPDADPARHAPAGPIVEVPFSSGFSRRPFSRWRKVHGVIASPALRAARLPGLAARARVLAKGMLAPERESVDDMLVVARQLLAEGARHLMLVWHSPSLRVGCTPFVSTRADRARLLGRIAGLLEGIAALAPVRMATLREAGSLAPPRGPTSAAEPSSATLLGSPA